MEPLINENALNRVRSIKKDGESWAKSFEFLAKQAEESDAAEAEITFGYIKEDDEGGTFKPEITLRVKRLV